MQRPGTLIGQLARVECEPQGHVFVKVVPDGGFVSRVARHQEHREKRRSYAKSHS